MNSTQEVLDSLSSGNMREFLHRNLELKETWSREDGHKLSALGNKLDIGSCWMVVGVNDAGQLVGRTAAWVKQTEETISQHINEKLDPIQACAGITAHEVGGAFVIIIQIRNPGDVVYWGSNAYAASGTTQKKMEPEEILELRLRLPGLKDFTRQPCTSEYDARLVRCFIERLKAKGHSLDVSSDMVETLRQLSLTGTQAARVLFGSCPFRVVHFDADENPVHQTAERGLYQLLTDEFQSHIQSATAGLVGKEYRPYPPLALTESLANAVAHAAYFEQDGDVILEIRPTSLTISNLCLRESRYFANRWFSRSHKTVNAFLMETLRVGRHVDELGRGKNVIFAESIKNGKRPPQVHIQRAGKYFRWSLTLHGNVSDRRHLRVFSRIKDTYGDTQKALIAQALVLWSNRPVSEIRNYIDDTFSDAFAEVLSSIDGPIFYYAKEDRITLHRWVQMLLEEGKDSKQFTPAEEERFRTFARQFCDKFENGHVTPKMVRSLAHLSESSSAKTMSSNLLREWEKEGHVHRLGKGKYKFVKEQAVSLSLDQLRELVKRVLTSKGTDNRPAEQTNPDDSQPAQPRAENV